MRSLVELLEMREPGWPVVEQMIAQATNPVAVLSTEVDSGARTLTAIQVTTRSLMGAIAYQTGGLLVDHGWIRILGAGHPRLPRDLGRWNFAGGDPAAPRKPGSFLVADDVVGGFFAMNAGAFGGPTGNVFYLAPDSLEWEDLGRGYTDFIQFLFAGDIAKFYEGQRWRGWETDVENLPGDLAFNFSPFLFTKCEGGIEARNRKEVDIEELWGLHAVDLPRQLRS